MIDLGAVHRYHDGTKHHFHRFARSLGYLDWASQPNPFRTFPDAPRVPLPPRPDAPAGPGGIGAIGAILRHALGLSAWKEYRGTRWSLRVNPSSGNLHPTEAYVVLSDPVPGLAPAAVYHYAADEHALEQRCVFENDAARGAVLVALASIHWREAWKYGERAFRYCQHDLGHAIAAVRIAAGLAGWRAWLLPEWSHDDIASLVGIDRDDDYVDAEREEPGCLMMLCPPPPADAVSSVCDRHRLLSAVRKGRWYGRANQLSQDHIEWTIIDEIARLTRDVGRAPRPGPPEPGPAADPRDSTCPGYTASLILQRRSALALDGRSSLPASRFFRMLGRLTASCGLPWDALWWQPRLHLAIFVHRVDGLVSGLYVHPRRADAGDRLKMAMRPGFLWDLAGDAPPLFLLARGDFTAVAQRLSCDQEIAADGFFSLAMIAEFDPSLREQGLAFYRHLFWESGVIGQVLYLEAEAAGARATGIGCFYDDPVHEALGLNGHDFQSLYHFSVGIPVEDRRLLTEPGYRWG